MYREFKASLGCGVRFYFMVAYVVTSPKRQEDHWKYQDSLGYIA